MESGTGNVYKDLLSDNELHENRCSGSHN